MIDYSNADSADFSDSPDLGVKVVGVGGAGANVLDRMALEGSDDAELLTLNTDVRALSTSVSSEKIQLGATLLKGMGTGGDPSLGKQSAIEAVDEIRQALRGSKMVFVCVGLGGGTGSGAAPEVCRIAREEGVFLVVFATLPFSFEGERRMSQARAALEQIGRYANAVITFDNDRMGELIVPKDGVAQAFAAADKIISQSIRATMNVVFRPGLIRIGMDDLLTAINSEDSRCLFGYGVAKGDNRAHEALEQALKCPLLDRGKLLNEADSLLVQVAGGESMTLFEVQLVMAEISKHVGSKTQILFGTGTDKRLGNSLTVTIISSIPGPGTGAISDEDEELNSAPPISLGMTATEVAPPAAPRSLLQPRSESEQVAVRTPELEEFSVDESIFDESVDDLESEDRESEESSVFEPLHDGDDSDPVVEERPAYSPQPIPPLGRSSESRPVVTGEDDDDEAEQNPIARALNIPREPERMRPPAPKTESGDLDRVEAVTESAQKITLTRMVSSGNTSRIRTRDPLADPLDGPALPPNRPPVMPKEELSPAAQTPEEVRQQQEMLQLEPVAGKGRFAKTDPTIVDGEDLDVPTFLRKKR